MNIGITNSHGERLDAEVGGVDGPTAIIFVHGFGSNKNEGENLFVDIAEKLNKIAKTVRFDFSGYGSSEGKQEEVSLPKMAADLRSVLIWADQNIFGRKIIIAHSLGTLVTSYTCPEGIERSIFTGLPRADTQETVNNIQRRITSRPDGVLNPSGISIYPRTSGTVQKIGPDFWASIAEANILELMKKYALKTELTIIKPIHDEVTGPPEITGAYRSIPGARYLEISGTHNFARKWDRNRLIKIIKQIVEEP
jgi:hypothetical protein